MGLTFEGETETVVCGRSNIACGDAEHRCRKGVQGDGAQDREDEKQDADL